MFCSRPFTQFYVDVEGDAYQCCPGWLTRKMGNILTEDPLAIWHSAAAEEIRASILDQSFRYCEHCPFLPNQFLAGHLEAGEPRQMSCEPIESLVLSYDPVCNLSCPSCRQSIKGSGPKAALVHQAVVKSGLLGKVRNISTSDVGDPIASLQIWNALTSLDEASAEPTISLHTNGLLFTPEKWGELGANQKRVTAIIVSIDAACESTYKLNRGGQWELLMANLEWMSKVKSFVLDFNFVYQTNNFREMPDFVRLADRFGVRFVRFSYLVNKGTYSHEDYTTRAIHKSEHVLHDEFLEILRHPLLTDSKRVYVCQ